MDKLKKAQLKFAYKMALTPHGLYVIRNLATGACFVDTSTNTTGAMNRHRFELQRGVHRCKALQQDWARDGEQGFVMEVVQPLEERAEPDFDYAAALEDMLKAWRQANPEAVSTMYKQGGV
ncbi:GIY-YIG nuclease family protein [Undibacterium sp. TJN25]|uniref:GIY-YIG nuclease family protein n=1 Tax=Undibacterium sp. TJN25 TaxID=3413056 RepID=UPI003BF3D95D